MRTLVVCLMLSAAAMAQQGATAAPPEPPAATQPAPLPSVEPEAAPPTAQNLAPSPQSNQFVVPVGTKVPIALKHAISTKNAKPGDPIYAETSFPVVIDGKVMIPVGTYVQGEVTRVTRPIRIKGRAELTVKFTTLIFPNGYTVMLPGSVDSVPGAESGRVKDSEGTMQADGDKGKQAGTVLKTTEAGAGAGAIVGAVNGSPGLGAGVGAGAGLLAGLGYSLFSHGPDMRIESGTTIEMVIERPVTIDRSRTRY